MEMGDALSPMGAVVDDDAETLREITPVCDRSRYQKKVTENLLVVVMGFTETRNHLLGYDENMGGRLRVKIMYGYTVIVFKFYIGGYFAFNDLFENGLFLCHVS